MIRRPPAGRIVVGLGLVMAWLTCSRVLRVDGIPFPRGFSAWLPLDWATTSSSAVVASCLFVAAVGAIVWQDETRPHLANIATAIAATLFALAGHIQSAQWPGNAGANRALVVPGAALVAYLAARLTEPNPKNPSDTRAVDAACGVVAACYFLAGASKVTGSGASWASPSNLAMHITTHAYGGVAELRDLRLAIADTPSLCAVMGIGTLVIELGFLTFIVRAMRTRLAVAAALMHVSIALVMGLHHHEWMLVTIGLAMWSARLHAHQPANRSPRPRGSGSVAT